MANCVVCQAGIEDDARFCPSCGAEQPRVLAHDGDDPFIGKTIARNFKIEKLLGVGGMGKVYKARQLSLDKDVVIKVLHDHFRDDPQLVQRFQREARAASRLNHPNSIQVIDFGQDESGVLFMAIEFLNGTDLFTVLQKEGPFPAERVARIMIQVCSALHEAHEQNVIHRDLKPENIMVEDRRGRRDVVKVLDFGIAKIQDPDDRGGQALTQAGMVCGTPEYMSPEQARGQALDARSDLYSLGVLVYQLTTGELPFVADSPIGIVTKHILEQPAPPRAKYPQLGIPASLERIILKAMDKDAGNRFQTAAQMQMAFEDTLRTSSGVVTGFEEPSQMAILRGSGAPAPLSGGAATEDAQPAATASSVGVGRSGVAGPSGAPTGAGTQVQMAKTGDTPAQTGGGQLVVHSALSGGAGQSRGPRPTSPTPTGLVEASPDEDFAPRGGGAKIAAAAGVVLLLVVGGVAFAMKDSLFGGDPNATVATDPGAGTTTTGDPGGAGTAGNDATATGGTDPGPSGATGVRKQDGSSASTARKDDDRGQKPGGDKPGGKHDRTGKPDRGKPAARDDGKKPKDDGDGSSGQVVSRKPPDDDGEGERVDGRKDEGGKDEARKDEGSKDEGGKDEGGKDEAGKDEAGKDQDDPSGRDPESRAAREARDDVKKPKEGDRERAKSLVAEANRAFLAGNSDKAYDLAKDAMAADPSYAESRMIIANIHLKNGAKDKACRAGRDYVALKNVAAAKRQLMLKRFCGE